MSGTDTKGTASSQDRATQPGRACGGNTSTDGMEKHGQAKATRISQGGSTGKNSTFGLGRDDGGNCAKGTGEKHSRWGQGKSRAIPANIEVASRGESAGNDAAGPHEPTAKGSKTVPASRRFDG